MKYNKENAWLLKNKTKSLSASALSTLLYHFSLGLSSSIPVLFFCLLVHLFLKWSPEGNSSSALDLLSTLCYTRGVLAAAKNGTTHCLMGQVWKNGLPFELETPPGTNVTKTTLETVNYHIQTKETPLAHAPFCLGQVPHPNKSWAESLQYMDDAFVKNELLGWTKHHWSIKDLPGQTCLPHEAENICALEKGITKTLTYM